MSKAILSGKWDFGDGGAYPEIHVSQYPMDMGRPGKRSNALPVTTDAQGKIQLTALVRQGQREDKLIYSRAEDMLPKSYGDEELERPNADEVAEETERTRKALEALVSTKISGKRPNGSSIDAAVSKTSFIRYRASRPASGAEVVEERVIKMVEAPKDPLEPPKFRVKKAPARAPSPPVPVQHEPPRKLTMKDMEMWKVPPCISNWKNPKGYTIPLDKRLAADGRGLQAAAVNDNFAKVSEALYMAEVKAREEVDRRKDNAKKLALKQKEIREGMLRDKAREARDEKMRLAAMSTAGAEETAEDAEQRRMRDDARDERRRQYEKARRQQERKASFRGGADREVERDITEQFALRGATGLQVPRSGESMYDSRLFNQDAGQQSSGEYSKALFGEKRKGNFKADRKALDEEHARQSNVGPRPTKELEFERDAVGDDLFGDLFGSISGGASEGRRPRERDPR
eukprot:Hpha_TRINITY_DN29710_c0_g1::TRINITY_DN29710_c0_g1_i1::g.2615::m.2615/K06063/SNW1, SKIIP, SKIP; SNW domain-containing protein 1